VKCWKSLVTLDEFLLNIADENTVAVPHFTTPVNCHIATCAQRYKIIDIGRSTVASKQLVVHLQVVVTSAILAGPAIPF
jgi:hypothetical protein